MKKPETHAENRLSRWYKKYERRVSTAFLLGGFVIDSITLQRVDSLFENLWTIGLLLGAAISMILIHYIETNPGDEFNPYKLRFWLVNALQFFFGGLLSVFLVFYFRSGDFFVSWPFFLILVVACLANEILKNHYVRLTFQSSLLFLAIFCCSIFLLPVFLHKIGTGIFILSGVVSLMIMWFFVSIIARVNPKDYAKSKRMLFGSVGGIFLVMNILYAQNLIPPIPLSLKDSGVYYSIQKNTQGSYVAEYEDKGWRSYFKFYDEFKMSPGTSVYAYSAVFAPTALNTTIVHNWQHYDDELGKWIDYSTVELPVVGGRSGGFRTYSVKTSLSPGKWRVNVENLRGQVIGRLRFDILEMGQTPLLASKVLE